jgi:rare lipoprotein A
VNALRVHLSVFLLLLLLGGCASEQRDDVASQPAKPTPAGSDRDGTPGYRADLANAPDAVPRPEVRTKAGNKSPYTVLGKTYRVQPVPAGHRERGLGSWYGTKFHGRKTSLGDDYDVYTMTAAHKTLPLPSYLRVTNLENGRRAVVRVNDRGPFHEDRVIDLSYAAAYRLGYAGKGTALLELEVLDPMAPEWVAKRAGREYQQPQSVARSAPSEGPDLSPEPARVAVPVLAREPGSELPDVVAQSESGAGPAPIAAEGVAVADAAAGSGVSRTWLQAGAFRSMDGARSLQRSIAALVDQDVVIQTVSGWHRVRVGPLANLAALDETRRRLESLQVAAQVVTE